MYESNYIKSDQIVEKLYLGGMSCAENENALYELKISHILIVGSYLECSFPDVKYLPIIIEIHLQKNKHC